MMPAPQLCDASCAVCKAPVVACWMRDGGVEILDAASDGERVVMGPRGGMVASRAWSRHDRTCSRRRGESSRGDKES